MNYNEDMIKKTNKIILYMAIGIPGLVLGIVGIVMLVVHFCSAGVM